VLQDIKEATVRSCGRREETSKVGALPTPASGALRFRLADRKVIAPAGSTVLVPAGVAHTFANAGPGPSRYLILLTATLDSLITELHQVDATEHPRIYRKYNSEVLE
jgi:hypothetical protein